MTAHPNNDWTDWHCHTTIAHVGIINRRRGVVYTLKYALISATYFFSLHSNCTRNPINI
jgi:hypothetical protein